MKKGICIFILVVLIALLPGCNNAELKNNTTTNTDETKIDESIDSTDSVNTDNQTTDTTGKESEYKYMDFVGWEFPNNASASIYLYSSDLLFEEGDTVAVDKLIKYFTHYEMINPHTHELYDYLNQYNTTTENNEYEKKYEICIPKEIVNRVIEKHFAVKVDSSDSQYTHPEKEDCYLLVPRATGGMCVCMRDYSIRGNRSTAVYALYDCIDKRIFNEVEICIENETSEENFKIVYVRTVSEKTGDGSLS